MKNRVLVIGPWSSGHIQKWLGNCNEFDVRILTCHKFLTKSGYDVRGGFLINSFLSFFIFPLFLIYHTLRFKPDILHVHYSASYGFLSFFMPIKKIVSIWGTDFNRSIERRYFKHLYIFMLRRFTIINSPSENITRKLICLGIKKENILTLQYGIDLDFLSKYQEKKNNNIIISSIRNWDDLYQIEELITLWDDISPSGIKLRIFGKTNDKIKENKIKNLIINSKSDIELIGFLSGELFYSKLSESVAFISVPLIDGMPLSVMECLFLKLFPIISDIPANKELILNEPYFFISTPIQKTALSNCLDIIKSKSFAGDFYSNAEHIANIGDIRKNRETMFNVYKYLISNVKSEL
ncbi:glycosyltransferase [Colwellia hornerae]|uniref:Glycosyltransferase family 4 protein n=1 Tax=Colwellia hornerae TaxID=89402 RepID=A0A5C6QKN4_9GAMM|nr:glycosyltransferase [Colwellia hornerae]TWX54047.1 glycosyltransferase family 4 protein [Colwellia hornerae]TWX60822.1 glycosyltransferase family 4 protein [Colwellia hornerae]TWX69152.1 glycosyltransferase family 4 protein [Colwellia hornerae]